MQKHIAITGSGAAALSLARLIADAGNVTVISDSLTPSNDKTWCFWDENAIVHPNLIHHKWNQLQIITSGGQRIDSNGEDVVYFCTRSGDFQKHIIDELKSNPSIQLSEGHIRHVTEHAGKVQIQTTDSTIQADLVFQSHSLPPDKSIYAKERVALKQHFLGWDIRSQSPLFDPDKAILMDFRVSQEYGFAFVYVLPFSETQALIEITYFTEELLPERSEYAAQLKQYLKHQWKLGVEEFIIEREEFGVIPMVDGHIESRNTHPIYSIGMAGGHAKASTGYAFARIQRDSRRIADALLKDELPPRGSLSKARFRYYDLLILNIIRNNPSHAVTVFEELFRKNGFRAMLSFMDEKTSFIQDLAIMASVPRYNAFFKSIWETRSRISAVIEAR